MVWTAPRTYVANEIITHTINNLDGRDNLLVLSVHGHDGSAGEGDDVLTGIDSIVWDDIGSPTANQLKRNGVNLEYHNGTKVVAITEADAAAATPSPRTIGTGALQAAAGDHGHGFSGFTNAGETVAAASAGGTTITHVGEYTVGTSSATTYDDVTKTKKVAAYHILVSHHQNTGNGSTVISIDVDGVEQTSFTIATSTTRGNIHLLALAVKNTADIQFEVFLTNNSSDASAVITMSSHLDRASNGTTTNPTGMTSIVDLAAA